jgi:hypothetical protein
MDSSKDPDKKVILLNDNKKLVEYLSYMDSGRFFWSSFEPKIRNG